MSEAITRNPVWEVRDLVKTFPAVRALDHVSLRLHQGQVHALVGQNGSGKSTLSKCLAGVYQPDAGTILHLGRTVELRGALAARKHGISIFYQELSLVPSMTVAENVCLDALASHRGFVSWRRLRQTARAALDRLEVAIDPDRSVGELSVAEQQLVEIAQAISSQDVSLLILDEPTAALGPDEVRQLHDVVRRVARQAAVLYISHRLEDVLSVADVVTVLRDGRVVGKRLPAETSLRELARMIIGAEIEDYYARSDKIVERTPLLEANEFRTTAMSQPVSFTVRRGEVFGIGGLIASGRTAIARAACGVDRPLSGELLLEGHRVELCSPADAVAAGIALLPENRKADALFLNLSVPQNISIARLRAVSRGPLLSLRTESDRARDIARLLQLTPAAERRPVGLLSGGTQQKVVLGRWLFAGMKLLVLEEPTQGVDVGAKREIYALIDDLMRRGLGIIMVSSDYPELLSISDRIAVVRAGRIVHTAARGELSQSALIEIASSDLGVVS